MRYGSVCSGIEAVTQAWHQLGWQPIFFSEIDKFPSVVLAHHYPHVPNLGDMTNFKEWPDATLDVLVGGTPCQSYSVAGLRAGLDDPRGSLMLTYVAIARRYRPRWVVWENVPGVLSSNKGTDFGSFLGLLTGRNIIPPQQDGQTAESYRATKGLTVSHGECLTLNISEYHSGAVASSLSDILETGDVPQRFFLSGTACRGILRRAEKRGKRLPQSLQDALQAVGSGQT